MSPLALEGGGFDLPQWDGYSDFLDQSTSYLDGGANEWLPDTMSLYMSSPGTFIQNSASSAGVSSTTSVSSADPESVIVAEQQNDTQSLRKKHRGRPKIDPENAQVAKERRRTQVRLAQQAYRHRKETTVASLKVEVEDLKARLTNIQFSFDQLQAITLRFSLQPSQLDIVQSLSKVVRQYRLPQILTGDNGQLDNAIKLVEWKHQYIAPSAVDLTPTLKISQDADKGIHTQSKPPHFQDSSMGISHTIQTRYQNLEGPSIPLLDQLPPTPVPFALRLRHEALKCGYHLITSQDASFASLSRPFQYHIFSESRDSIIKRLRYQLYQSAKLIYQNGSGSRDNFTDPFISQQSRNTFPSPSQKSQDPTTYYSVSDFEPATKEVDEREAYIDANAVERYLLEKGLEITAESNFISVPAGTTLRDSPTPTLFDEMRGGRELKLSVGKLLHELLSKARCLDLGPAFRRVEIDEALRSTMIEAI